MKGMHPQIQVHEKKSVDVLWFELKLVNTFIG